MRNLDPAGHEWCPLNNQDKHDRSKDTKLLDWRLYIYRKVLLLGIKDLKKIFDYIFFFISLFFHGIYIRWQLRKRMREKGLFRKTKSDLWLLSMIANVLNRSKTKYCSYVITIFWLPWLLKKLTLTFLLNISFLNFNTFHYIKFKKRSLSLYSCEKITFDFKCTLLYFLL